MIKRFSNTYNNISVPILTLSAALFIGCAVPVSLPGHDPKVLLNASCTESAFQQIPDAESKAISPVVIKRFDAAYPTPVGGNFIVGNSKDPSSCEANTRDVRFETLSQIYNPATDLAFPIFESAFSHLRIKGYPVWKDYDPTVENISGPPNQNAFVVVKGVVSFVELDTFTESDIKETARVTIDFTAVDQTSRPLNQWTSHYVVKFVRDGQNRDVMDEIGQQVAAELATAMWQ